MAKLPAAVERLRQKLPKHTEIRDEFGEAACKLLDDSPQLAAMWRAIERRSEERDPWVAIFLGFVKGAAELPPYHYLKRSERLELVAQIMGTAGLLARLLEENQLDCHLIHSSGHIFNGFYFYEGFGESNRARIDADGAQKAPASRVIKMVASRAKEKISNEPVRGKVGRNVRAIRFVRMIAARFTGYYGQPLLPVIRAAVNTIFDTDYSEGDIQNLLTR
jgi:hypothetical protein